MYFDNTTVYKQARPFIYVYPNNTNTNTNNNSSTSSNSNNNETRSQQKNSGPVSVSSPSSSSSGSSVISTNQQEQPKKKKRQHVGYACDKCRERRVGCDRGKPICGQCKDRYTCQYSNHALRLDNVSMRQRLDDLENQVGFLTSIISNMEEDYRSTVKSHVQPTNVVQEQQQLVAAGPSVYDWAVQTGWPVIENADGIKSIFTTIKNFEDLSEALRNTVEAIYNLKGIPLFKQPSPIINPMVNVSTPRRAITLDDVKKEHTFTLFESLNRYTTTSNTKSFTEMTFNTDDSYLETDIKTRLIHQHHKCGFPTLVSPSRFENHYRQGQLKSLVLSSVFSHSVPHCCIYHPHLTQIQNFRDLGNKFYNHSHDLLGIDEPANLSNIHQRTMLIVYDLDVGRVRRAFLHIGIAIRMCFMLNLHRPEGYASCKSAYEREQSKRIFWTVWFYDNMVPHLFPDQLHTIKTSQISIELPTPLPEFNPYEMDQTTFAISLIQIRKLAGSISEKSRKLEPQALVHRYKEILWRFYHALPHHLRFGKQTQFSSIWTRRSYFCILLDYCLCWITIYRALLPPAHLVGERPLSPQEQEAVLHTSQAAVALVQLFQSWFDASLQSGEGFDCFFRPYLYHFMSAKHIFTANVAQYGRSPALVYVSRAYLVLILQLYQTTPTRVSVEESALEKSIMEFLNKYQIGRNEVVYQAMIDEALVDDSRADCGWSIFADYDNDQLRERFGKDDYLTDNVDDVGSKCSSGSSIVSDSATTELDLDYL